MLRIRAPLTRADLPNRLQTGLRYYADHKPHQGIGGATPAELFYGNPPATLKAVRPRRVYEVNADESHADTAAEEQRYGHPSGEFSGRSERRVGLACSPE